MRDYETAVIKTFILLIVLLTAAAFPYRAYAEESVIIDGYSADIPPELEKSLSDAGITPQSIDSEALSVDKVISNVTGMLWESIKSPLKLLISLISVTLLCSIANVFADNTSGNLKTVFSLVSVLACSTITVSAASDSLTAASKRLSREAYSLQALSLLLPEYLQQAVTSALRQCSIPL